MLIRVQSSEGTKRVEVDPSFSASNFLGKVGELFNLAPDVQWSLCRSRNGGDPLYNSDASVSTLGLRHGDMTYLSVFPSNSTSNDSRNSDPARPGQSSKGDVENDATRLPGAVEEDEIDGILSKANGTVARGRDAQFCRHGDQGRCIHCIPIEPFDAQYLAEHEIKHMSFHSYLRKLHSGVDKGKFVFLENLSCKIKPGCTEHTPWPNGICTKCQPNAVTLKRQDYRHIDNICFEDRSIIARFLDHWRSSGLQRVGILYGKYEEHKDVPLGIKAVVSAIYEPPQASTQNSVKLLPDENEDRVLRLGKQLGLKPVGWVFCDLETEDRAQATVKYFRHMETYFLSAEECVMAADLQTRHPSPCKFSSSGYFGSKFSTVVVSGGVDNQICMEGYQVTDQCMALVRDECFVPTVDAPELGYVKESSTEQYVPDVFYKEKDKYGSEVTKMARPLPVEYLLVQVPVAAPVNPNPLFATDTPAASFPIENRSAIGEAQDFPAFCKLMREKHASFLDAVCSFHVLCFMACSDMLPVRDTLGMLCEAIVSRNSEMAERWCASSEWATVQQMMDALGDQPMAAQESSVDGGGASGGNSSASAPSASMWQCEHCTFLNQSSVPSCDMCSLPRVS